LGLYVAAALTMPPSLAPILIPGGLLLACTIVFTLYGCYCQERDDRLNWLLHLRERLLLQDLENANQQLQDASRSDMLTEVANRRHFDEHLAEVWEQVRRDGGEVALMMIDVDHFKAYNDRYGHPAGDACLKAVASALRRRLRGPGDLIARYGGEEFIAVLGGTSLQTVHGAAERIRRGIEGLNILHATSSTHAVVTVSIGVATMTPSSPGASTTRLISAADEALYRAKEGGRNRVFAMGMDE
jgi:diguanylate cyclase (GGDEF)-like protein